MQLNNAISPIQSLIAGSTALVRYVLIAAAIFPAAAAHAAVYYVRFDAPAGGNGLSWATAFQHVGSALAASGAADEIWVARGAYFPDESPAFPTGTGDRTATFHVQGDRKLVGGFAGTESNPDQRNVWANPTILCGDLLQNDGANFANYDENSYHIVGTSGSTASALIDGFVIAAGNANANPPTANSNGAGVIGSYPPGPAGLATIRNCRIQGNFAEEDGAGAYVHHGMFVSCQINGNRANDVGGGLASCGGAIVNCKIAGNRAFVGGAMFSCFGAIQNCLFVGNVADLGTVSGGSGSLRNCTFAGNLSGTGSTIRFYTGTITNCILFGNDGSELSFSSTPTYSCIEGGGGGVGSITSNPLYVDADGADNNPTTWEDNDYRISVASPCVDAGANSSLLTDVGDVDFDGNTAEPTPLDLRTASRRAEIHAMPNVGVGAPPLVDMGAFEAHCSGDVTGDGHVQLNDLAILLANFGVQPALAIEGDLNGDGVVDLVDLALLLANFGSSC